MNVKTKVRILLVEDNPVDVRFVNELLSELGRNKFSLFNAGTLSEAISLISKKVFDIILLDLNLPDSKGFNTVSTLRSKISNIPIIVLTVAANKDLSFDAFKNGIQDFLIKGSINSELLGRVINYAIARMTFENALNAKNNMFYSFLNSVKELAILIDTKGNIILANETAAKRFKLSVNEFVGKNFYALIPHKIALERKKHIDYAIKNKKSVSFNDIREGLSFENYIYPIIERDKSVKEVAILGLDVTKRDKAEKALREIESRYRTLSVSASRYRGFFEGVRDGVLILDSDGLILDVNPFLIELLGYSHKVFLGKHIWEIGLFKDVAANKKEFAKLLVKKYVKYEDLPLQTNTGKRIDVEFVSTVYTVDNKKVIQCNIRDITERLKDEGELKQRMKELSIIYETGKIMENYKLSEALKMLVELIPKSYSFPEIACARIFYDNHKFETNNFRKTKYSQFEDIVVNGKKRGLVEIYYLKNKPFLAEEIKMLREVVAQISNITNRKTSRDTLLVSASRYRGFFEGVRDGVLILDSDGLILDVNPFLIELLGYSHKVFLGKHIWEIGLFKDVAANKKEFAKLLVKKYVKYEDLPLQTNTGKRIDVEFVSTVYTVDNKKVIQCNIRDITERLKSEQIKLESEAQKKIDKLREEFLILITHDLKQPLTPIIGYTEIIKEELKSPANIEYSNKIIAEAFRLKEMIDKVLNLLRIESNNLTLDIKKLNIKDVINETIKIKNSIMDLKHIKLLTELKDTNALFDSTKLKDVMLNLFDNAIKFSKEGGKIKIKSYTHNNYAYISISDYGVGIKEKDIPKLFTKYFQTKEGKEAGGTGVGLAICKELINAMKGTIRVKSKYGKGTEFIIRLPLKIK